MELRTVRAMMREHVLRGGNDVRGVRCECGVASGGRNVRSGDEPSNVTPAKAGVQRLPCS